MEAKIISKKIVKPAVPTPDHHRTCKMSFFDQLAPTDHIPIIFFYNNTSNQDNKHEKLIKSLSETLTRFYQLAGRFVEDGYYIDCNDQGAEYIEAEINIDLGEFLSIAPKNIHLLELLVPRDNFGASNLVTTPILCTKVTTFKCGGLAICMHLSHKVADGLTAATFYNEWSVASRLGSINQEASSSPNFGLIGSFFPPRDLSVAIKPEPIPSIIPQEKIVTRRLIFDEKYISTLKTKVSNGENNQNITRPTRVEVVTSIIWRALISITASQSKSGNLKDSTLYLFLNLRGRTSIVTPQADNKSFCGNYYIQVPAKFKADKSDTKMKELELHDLLNLFRNSLGNAFADCSKISSPDDLFLEVAKHVNEIREDLGKEEVNVMFLSTLCRFPFYDVDFGWGKPELVTTVGMPLEVVFLMDTKCGTGVVAMVSLYERNMIEFERDPDVIAFIS